MSKYAVDPDALRDVAGKVAAVAGDADTFSKTCAADVGHAGLAAALSRVGIQTESAWSQQVEEIDQTASRLRTSADMYERADENAFVRYLTRYFL